MRNTLLAKRINTSQALDFVIAGKAYFTLRSEKTQKRFTYRVTVPRDKDKDLSGIYFVSLLTGIDNNSMYSYIGVIRKQQERYVFQYGVRSKIGSESPGVIAFTYCFNNIISVRKELSVLEFWHEGLCCRCGRLLTVPESIESGIGPECIKIKAKKHKQLI